MIAKLELHLHLEGAAQPGFIRGLAQEKHRSLPPIFDATGAWRHDGFDGFLRVYEAAAALVETPRDYARLVAHALENAGEQGAIYVELFVSPDFCGGGDLSAWRDYLAAMEEAAAALRAQGIDSRAIVTCIRHFGPERARRAALCAAETGAAGGTEWVAGFGMGGAETVGRATDFAWSFDCAREAGLGLTCHAGEWAGPDSVREALALGVTRIGHGVRAVEDPALVRELAARGILLEVCPGANLALGLYPSLAAHPVARLLDAGCRVCISTDDPPFFGTDLGREYDRLADTFGWDEVAFRQMNLWAAEGAFCDATTRTALIQRLEGKA